MIYRNISRTFLLWLCAFLFCALLVCFFFLAKTQGNNNLTDTASQRAANYPLLAKRIFVENPNDIIINFVELRKNLEARLESLNTPYSFYFEYLPNGTSIRVGGDYALVAASLLKLPYVMDLYYAAELGRVNLDDTITLKEEWIDKNWGILWERGAGGKTTYREAAKLALTNSDNTAKNLIRAVTQNLLAEHEMSLAQANIEVLLDPDKLLYISSRSFASILKCLYFSCYLSPQSSQEILLYLTQSVFDDRITSVIPDDVPVAHKIANFPDMLTVSDCGIVYVPKRPYILCMMVGLPDLEANNLISDISREVYEYVSGVSL